MPRQLFYVPVPLRDELPSFRVPPLVASDIERAANPLWSEREIIRVVRDEQGGDVVQQPPHQKSDPTVTIMWIGAIASVGGLTLEILKLLRGK